MYIHMVSWTYCPGPSASVSGDNLLLSVKKGKLESPPSPLHGHNEQYKASKALQKCGYDKNLGFLAYCRSWEVA